MSLQGDPKLFLPISKLNVYFFLQHFLIFSFFFFLSNTVFFKTHTTICRKRRILPEVPSNRAQCYYCSLLLWELSHHDLLLGFVSPLGKVTTEKRLLHVRPWIKLSVIPLKRNRQDFQRDCGKIWLSQAIFTKERMCTDAGSAISMLFFIHTLISDSNYKWGWGEKTKSLSNLEYITAKFRYQKAKTQKTIFKVNLSPRFSLIR